MHIKAICPADKWWARFGDKDNEDNQNEYAVACWVVEEPDDRVVGMVDLGLGRGLQKADLYKDFLGYFKGQQ